MSLEIGELLPAEIEAAVALWQVCGLTRPWNDPFADARLALDRPEGTVLAGRLEGELVATAMVGFDAHRAWVYYLAVAPGLQGRGFGRALMAACEDWAKARGAPKLQLMVRGDNAAAKGFYSALGYRDADVSVLARRF